MDKIQVLYAEDEPFLGKIVKESLESREFAVRMVADGAKVMDAFRECQPEICVLDVMLPHRDGFSLGEDIRKEDPHIPIIFLTAKNQTQDLLKGFASGGNDYIKKPFSVEELIVRMHNLLQLVRQQSSSTINSEQDEFTLGQFTFIPGKYELHHPENSRQLSHKETQILRLLAQKQNLPVGRKDIMLAVWGDDSFFHSRNLDVYITRLRGYLKPDPDLQIVTLKGVGYHFVVPA